MPRYFTQDHEWVEVEGKSATVGITDYAQGQLGDIVFVELPAEGTGVARGKEAAVVESVKAASDVFSPVTGTVTAANAELEEDPSLANSDAEDGGWFFQVTMDDPNEVASLMDAEAYEAYVAELD